MPQVSKEPSRSKTANLLIGPLGLTHMLPILSDVKFAQGAAASPCCQFA